MAKEIEAGVPARDDYNNRAFDEYTNEELEWWVHLLTKRAQHRKNEEKRIKDLYDASVYKNMLKNRS